MQALTIQHDGAYRIAALASGGALRVYRDRVRLMARDEPGTAIWHGTLRSGDLIEVDGQGQLSLEVHIVDQTATRADPADGPHSPARGHDPTGA